MSKAQLLDGVPAPGTVIGDKYVVGDTIASGGMGRLVKAEQQLLERDVAIKFVLAQRGSSAKARLLREARALRALTSDHVVRVFDLGVYQEAPYIVMELLQGLDLHARVEQDGPLPIDEAVDCVIEAATAVAEAHSVGIIHRDIKPANLFLARTRGRQLVKVLDFGISKVPETERDDDLHATSEDTVLGTPHFMSPEQLRNPAKIDERTDIWSLGVTLFYLLADELPFAGTTRREIVGAIFADEPLELRELRPEVSEALAEVIAAALEKRPEKRTPSVAALVEGLLPFASSRGRVAAQQLPRETDQPAPKKPSREMPVSATTEDGLASTLPATTEQATAVPSTDDVSASADPPQRTRAAALAAVALLAAGAVVWLMGSSRTTQAPAAMPSSTSAAPSATAEASAPADNDAADTSTPAAIPMPHHSAVEPPPAAKPPTSAVAASARKPRPTARVVTAAPTSSTSASPAPSVTPSSTPAVDIDGMPILE